MMQLRRQITLLAFKFQVCSFLHLLSLFVKVISLYVNQVVDLSLRDLKIIIIILMKD